MLCDRERNAHHNSGALQLEADWGWIIGPKEIDVARPGAALFGVEDNSEPDAIETAAREQWYQARLELLLRRLDR